MYICTNTHIMSSAGIFFLGICLPVVLFLWQNIYFCCNVCCFLEPFWNAFFWVKSGTIKRSCNDCFWHITFNSYLLLSCISNQWNQRLSIPNYLSNSGFSHLQNLQSNDYILQSVSKYRPFEVVSCRTKMCSQSHEYCDI